MSLRWSDADYAAYVEGKRKQHALGRLAEARKALTEKAAHPAPVEAKAPEPGCLSLTLPIRTKSELNSHAGWWDRANRAKRQRNGVVAGFKGHALPPLPAIITITRLGQRRLDSDNLAASAKYVRDAIASLYGVDDGSDLYTWRCEQEPYNRRHMPDFNTRIEIRPVIAANGALFRAEHST